MIRKGLVSLALALVLAAGGLVADADPAEAHWSGWCGGSAWVRSGGTLWWLRHVDTYWLSSQRRWVKVYNHYPWGSRIGSHQNHHYC